VVAVTHARWRRPAAALLVTLAVALLPVAAHADYKEAYKRGVDAIQQKRWDDAIRELRAAIAERPEAAGLMGAGLFRRYTPHYFLGVALSELGDCRSALDAFETAERQGKLTREDTADLQKKRQVCKQKVVAVAEAAASAQREIDGAAAAALQVAAVQSTPLMRAIWAEGSPSLESRQQAANGRLREARSTLEKAQSAASKEQVEEASKLAQQAHRELEALLNDASARRAGAQAEIDHAQQDLKKAVESARRELAFATRTLNPLPAAVAQKTARLQETLTAAAAADATTSLVDLRRQQEALTRGARELRGAMKPPPDGLQKAAIAYFAGDFAATLAALAPLPTGDPRVAAHACLLRAAALHGIHQLQPADDSRGLDAAREEIRRCQGLPHPVQPSVEAFPPSFRALWQEVASQPRA